MRLRVVLMLLGAALVVAVFTFPVWQPLIENRAAAPADAFPGLAPQMQDDFMSLPPEQQRVYLAFDQEDHAKALAMVTAALTARAALPDEDQAMPELNAPVTVASGTFQQINAVRYAQGTVNIFRDATNALTMRFEGFSMPNGPDLHVYLSAADAPKAFAELSAGGIEPVDIGQLKASLGSQNYVVPDGVDIAPLRSVAIYSTSLDLIYTYAPLFVRQQ